MACDLGVPVTESGEYYFISYNSEDAGRVSEIVKLLHARGVPMWYDKGIDYGNRFEEVIAGKIDGCEAFIMFFTEGILHKEESFVSIEYEMAKDWSERDIIVIMLDDVNKKAVPLRMRKWMIEIGRLHNVRVSDFSTKDELADNIAIALGIGASPKPDPNGRDSRVAPEFGKAGAILATSRMAEGEAVLANDSLNDLRDEIRTAGVGGIVRFGSYPQKGIGAQPDPIEWRVLADDGKEALLVSVYGLDACVFNRDRRDGNDWDSSYLKTLFLGEFSQNAGLNSPALTLSCLSIEEARECFRSIEDRKCIPTAYARDRGALLWKRNINGKWDQSMEGSCFWWLRSPGHKTEFAACGYEERISAIEVSLRVDRSHPVVRPAMRIRL